MNEDLAYLSKHLRDTAKRADALGIPLFSTFLSPAEQDEAYIAARELRVSCLSYGGYPDAERRIVCFGEAREEDFPIAAIEVRWPHQKAPGHRDLLGSVLGLGLKRSLIGDIVVEEERAILFADRSMAEMIARSWTGAGRIHLQTALLEQLPDLIPPKGEEIRCTVMSLRLDAVLSGGLNLSRSDATALVETGRIKRNHLPCPKPDERLAEGDVLSIAGYGRLVLEEIGNLTKKARLPLRLTRYGSKNTK